MSKEITILTKEQYQEYYKDIFNSKELNIKVSDFAVLSGASVLIQRSLSDYEEPVDFKYKSNSNKLTLAMHNIAIINNIINKSIHNKNVEKGEILSWQELTRSSNGKGSSIAVSNHLGFVNTNNKTVKSNCVRPVLNDHPICYSSNAVQLFNETSRYSVVEYGAYPQSAISHFGSQHIENIFKFDKIMQTGKTYTTGIKSNFKKIMTSTEYNEVKEHYYYGSNIIRIKANLSKSPFGIQSQILSNGTRVNKGDYVWVRVEPIKWIIDNDLKIAIAQNPLISNIDFYNGNNWDGNWNNTKLKYFLENKFIEAISNVNSNKSKEGMRYIKRR